MHTSHLTLASAFLAFSAYVFAGCARPANNEPAPRASEHNHDHPSEGPHHGELIELGDEEFHAELLHDDVSHKVTLYVLDAAATNSVPIVADQVMINVVASGAPQQFVLPAVPQDGDPVGKSSRFELADESLAKALDTEGAQARLNITIDEKPYVGKIEHHVHAEHKHK